MDVQAGRRESLQQWSKDQSNDVRPKESVRPRVALVVETSLAPGRDILRGVAQYVRTHRSWSVIHEPRAIEHLLPSWLDRWNGDGIIVRIRDHRIARAIAAKRIPTVDVFGLIEGLSFPVVHVDDNAIGHLAAEYLLNRGFRRFGFFGIEGENWSERRRQAFGRRVAAAGYRCLTHSVSGETAREERWENNELALSAWLESLPKPAGIMLATDQLGPHTLEACRRVGIAVPDELGVIGVDNDYPLCEVSDPPLTSVRPDHRRVGFEAARLLDQLMCGAQRPASPIYCPPRGIFARASTDTLAIDDVAVTVALRYIRQHGCEPIDVDEIVRKVPASRSVLQRRFRALLGRSIHDEIIRVRLERARELLERTNLPIAEIAERTGFRRQVYMGAVFKRCLHSTPAAIRRAASSR